MTIAISDEKRRKRNRERRNAAAAKLPSAIHWHEGMLLAPQHFQMAALRGEALPYYHVAAVSPFHWGVMELERGEFGEGFVRVGRVEAVMPDGLVAGWPAPGDDGSADLALDLTKQIKDVKEGKDTVYLAVAAHEAGDRFSQRYDFGGIQKVADDTTGRDELEVQVLRPKLQLVLAEELPSSYSGFPLAKVSFANGAIIEQPYEPPRLRVKHGTPLYSICERVATRLREAAKVLLGRVEEESASTGGAQLLERRMMLHGLVASLPPFEALLESGAAHPFQLYLAFATLMGSVAVGVLPERLEAYDHDDLLSRFTRVEQSIDAILRHAVKEPYAPHPFTLDGEEYGLAIRVEWISTEMVLGVRIPQGRSADEVDNWIMGATIAAKSKVDMLRKRRVTGIQRERLREHELIPTAGVVFYALKAPYGDLLLPGERLVISNHGEEAERRPEEIILWVRKGADR